MPIWPHDKRVELDAYFGSPGLAHLDTKWAAANLTHVPVPWAMTYAGQPVKSIQIHKKCAASLAKVMGAIWTFYGQKQAAIKATGLDLYGGSFNFRPVRGATTLSCHAYGAAIDFDPGHHPLGVKSSFPDPVIAAFKDEGWFWGGDFKSRPDGMHFQATTGA